MSVEEDTTPVSKERLRALPQAPGVYLMKDKKGTVLYVGKAKNLKSRVGQYFAGGDGRHNVSFLMQKVHSVETLVTADERQAIVLESDLIKKYRPRYNVRLKDDRAHLMVRVDMTHEWPKLELVRQVREDGARYVGPFAFSYELRTLLEVVKQSVPLRSCSDRIIYNRVRPCLEYQIKRCAGPCCLDVDKAQYLGWVEQAIRILEGHTGEVVEELQADMHFASEQLRFEDAAAIRDRLEIIARISADRLETRFGTGSMDSFGIHREGHNLELSVLMVRQGRLFESKTFGFSDVEVPTEELLGSLLTQYYANDAYIPESVLLPIELEDMEARTEILSEQRGAAVLLIVPQRGVKRRLLSLSDENAKQNFEARFSRLDRTDRVLKALQVELDLPEMPRTVECVDISHFQGGSTVAAVVCFQDMKPEKSRYRCFHMSQEGKPDDFASMREVVTRHLSRCAEENTLPDLLVVDGGPAQLAQALQVRRELGLHTPAMIGLAKKRMIQTVPYRVVTGGALRGPATKKPERVYLEDRPSPVVLNPRSEALHLLERIRNEAHRFAITFHRKTRARKTFRSELDGVAGIGLTRRNELLRVFRSVAAIRQSTPEEISERTGIPLKLAQKIHAQLNRAKPTAE